MNVAKLKTYLHNPRLAMLEQLGSNFWKRVSDEAYLKFEYRTYLGKKLNLNSPETFNEKIQWLKLYDRNPLYHQLVDKYLVRDYITNQIGAQYLVPLLGFWDSAETVNFDQLPQQFVLKPTHASGNVYICKDKAKMDEEEIRERMRHWLQREYFWRHREWPYKNVKPRIIAEEMIQDNIINYKFYCFNGEPKFVLLAQGFKNYTIRRNCFYDLDFHRAPFQRKDTPPLTKKVEKPENYNEMLEIATILSKDMRFVRVDLYGVNGKTYFSELTFYPCAGNEPFEPEAYDKILGDMLQL